MKFNKSAAYLITAAVFWGAGYVSQSFALATLHPLAVVFLRYVLASAALYPLAVHSTKHLANPETAWINCAKSGILCGLPLSLAMIFQSLGMGDTGAGKAAFLTSLYVVFAPVIGIFLRKKVTGQVWGAVALSILGSFLLCVKAGFRLETGDLSVLMCALLAAIQIHLIEYVGDHGYPLVHSFFSELTTCAVSFVLMMVSRQAPSIGQILPAVLPLLFAGFVAGAAADTCALLGQKDLPASVAAILMSLESVFGALFGVLLLHETMTLKEILGCVLIFAGVILAQLDFRKQD